MAGTIPFELIGLVCAVACIIGLLMALLTYVQRSRRRKRGDDHFAFVARARSDAPATTLVSVEDELASPTTTQARLDQESPSPPSDQEALRRQFLEPAPPSFATEPPRLEKPVMGMPGRMLDPLNLADDIDQMVQHKLRERPDLVDRRIRLASGRDGGLRIYVDGEVFEAVGDITDFKVRELIRDTICEWEGF
jgi:hypothetical protein